MNPIVVADISFRPDLDALMERLSVRKGSAHAGALRNLAGEAQAIARPKAFYRPAFVESKGDDFVVVEGFTLTSRVLRVNLDGVHRVFPYVATCGTELEGWSSALEDRLHRHWGEVIKMMALRSAIRALNEHLAERYRPGRLSEMSPGSLQNWPLQAQRALFALLGDPEEAVGVRLLDSLFMSPGMSVSGIKFPTEEGFESCQLCPRENCPIRRAPYDGGLYDKKYRPGAN